MLRQASRLAAIIVLLAARGAPGQAAQLIVERYDQAFAFFLDGGALNGQFDTIDFRATPGADTVFRNIFPHGLGGPPIIHPPGEHETYVNRLLDYPPAFGGFGFSVLGKSTTAEGVAFTTGPLGGVIDTSTSTPGIFLANILPERSVHATADLYRAGNLVASLTASGVVPEPTTFALAGAAGLLFALTRRGRYVRWTGRN